MYCELAGRECPYLYKVEEVQKSTLLAAATAETEEDRRVAAAASNVAEEWTQAEDIGCAEDYCKIIARAIGNSIVTEAYDRIRREEQEL